MSGGEFDYIQYRLGDVVERIGYFISNGNGWDDEVYSEDTIERFIEGYMYVSLAAIYMQRIDWLVSGDDGEESFHKRLDEEMKMLLGELSKKYSQLKYLNQLEK
jgi:hypothetical protein